ncbi:MAG: SDR family NAD(P)-dependent oxidoreductase [Pseudomonadota bacterium]|nr:SDR family NAD(P)-dependent oxidoreductase [Pseudomonadota bacterium]
MSKLTPPTGTALVTGASAGIGAAIVRRLVADGWRVVATARRSDRLQALAEELGADAVQPFALDVTDLAAVRGLPASLPAGWRDIDLLVNNAGLALGREPAQATEADDWEQMVDANVSGLMRCTHALLPGMVARGRGHIVNIGSLAGQLPYPGGNVYGASKAFVRHFSYGLLADLVATPVRCTLIEPGLVGGSEFSNVRFKGDDERAASIYADTDPLTPEDIADAVAWTVQQPARVNVSLVQVLPTCQGPGPVAVHKSPAKSAA